MKNLKAVELICVVMTLLLTRARGLKFVKLDVPPTADVFSPVTLRCEYELEGMNLYSVKWYKDGSEFFRFMPDYDPQSQAVKTSGIKVDLPKSGMNTVTLINLKFNNSGNYKCEISTEGPNFETVADSSNMTIMAYPSADPTIEGVLSTYSVGDYVSANCTSGRSYPPATLMWHVNGAKPEKLVWEYRDNERKANTQELQSKSIGLHFQILNSHLTNGGGGLVSNMEIRCTSTVGDSILFKSVYPTVMRSLTSNKLAQERQMNEAGRLMASSLNIIIVLITSLQMIFSS